MRFLLIILAISIVLLILPSAVWAQFSGGSGIPSDPWQIDNANDLFFLANNPDYYDDSFILTADINLDPTVTGQPAFTTALISPNGNDEFKGVFDGNDHVITNLTIDTGGADTDYLGMFGEIDNTRAVVKNLALVNVNIIGGDNSRYIGGLCGYNNTSINTNHNGIIINCYTSGSITGGNNVYYIGGLCGSNYWGHFFNCFSTCTIICSSGSIFTGGLCGNNVYGCLSNCYATGPVTGNDRIGGLCGGNDNGNIINCYSSGVVTGGSTASYYGGLCGQSTGSIINSYFLNTAGPSNGLGIPLTDYAMKQQSSFSHWDFVGEATNGTSSWWIIKPNNYPSLYYFEEEFTLHEFTGQGTKQYPYLISDPNDLGAVWQNPQSYYRLQNDIDLEGISWTAAIAPTFDGIFDGNNHRLSHLTISGSSFLGLFGVSRMNALIIRLRLENVNIAGGDYGKDIGSFCGNNSGYITNCHATGSVTSGLKSWFVGGLCGWNANGCISNCYSTVTVSGGNNTRHLSGLCANYGGSIVDCFATGTVSGGSSSYNLGGLCGYNGYGGVSNCYSVGSVSSGTGSGNIGGLCGVIEAGNFSNCYFLESSGPNNGLGTPLSDPNMRIQSNFVGWDSIGESTNGTSSSWIFHPGQYPSLYYFDYTFIPYNFAGQGSVESPYLIFDVDDLGAIRQRPDCHYQLQNDLNFAGINWSAAVVPAFLGGLDGNNYLISNIDISGGCPLGLLGIMKGGATVTRLDLENVSITGGQYSRNLGSMCGWNFYGLISDCHTNGTVTGEYSLGGLCGLNSSYISESHAVGSVSGNDAQGGLCGYNSYGDISNCFAIVSVFGDEYVGGLCGLSSKGSISNCYAKGSVNGNDYVGGLCGHNLSEINHCYSTGLVMGDNYVGGFCGGNAGDGSINACYFLNTAGPDNGIGSPLTESAMKQQIRFVGWDFMGETTIGAEDIWRMCVDGVDYPRLRWEFTTGDLACPDGVDLVDVAVMAANWLESDCIANPAACGYADLDESGTVDPADLGIMAEYWLGEK